MSHQRVHWESIRKIVIAQQLEDPASSVDSLFRFLRFWWCKTYNRPFKDPLLAEYTLDELTYEYLRHYFALPDNDPSKKIEAEQRQEDDEAWVKKMLAEAKAKKPEPVKPVEKTQEVPNLPDISASFETPPKS
jgi:hypothetical protein